MFQSYNNIYVHLKCFLWSSFKKEKMKRFSSFQLAAPVCESAILFTG